MGIRAHDMLCVDGATWLSQNIFNQKIDNFVM